MRLVALACGCVTERDDVLWAWPPWLEGELPNWHPHLGQTKRAGAAYVCELGSAHQIGTKVNAKVK